MTNTKTTEDKPPSVHTGRPSRLSIKQIRAIRLDKRIFKLIAYDFGISISYIAKIKSGEKARHRK